MNPAKNQSILRAAELLQVLAARPTGASVSEISRSVDLPRTTVTRLLATLEQVGFAERTDSRWAIGRGLVQLGLAGDPLRHVMDVARPLLEDLASKVQESALLIVVNVSWDAEAILQIDPPKMLGAINWTRRRFAGELHASAAGKLAFAELPDGVVISRLPKPLPGYTAHTITSIDDLLRELAQVRRQGYAETVDEIEVGVTGISVPLDINLVGKTTKVRAISLGISGSTARLPRERRKALLTELLACRSKLLAELR